jgi:transcriptional regulator with GAF, ATPase, and Fis domain
MKELLDNAEAVAALPSTLMITGESGVGKSLLARHIHYSSPRSNKPFVCVSCPALPRELLESELFGHEKGSFTGAHLQRIGKFELAQGGTLFLDEIGDLPLDLQPKLLNVLQDREIFRVGGSKAVEIDVRVIAATNIDLQDKIDEGEFREDLFYRLNVIALELPPLRKRPEDIETIVGYVLERLSKDRGLDKPIRLDKEALSLVKHGAWPGNVRQLDNTLERAAAFRKDGIITAEGMRRDAALSNRRLKMHQISQDSIFATANALP